jgi:hypothetical protein
MLAILILNLNHIPFNGDTRMRIYRALIVICFCAVICEARAADTDQALLKELRAKYDAPFARNLQSFDCAVNFSWKQHFTETFRVGDEGTDEELQNIFQPIKTRVTVSAQNVAVSAGMSEDAVTKLPHGGMAELLLEHAVQKSLGTWQLVAANVLLPDPSTPVAIVKTAAGYKLDYKVQDAAVEMLLASDMRLQRATLNGDEASHFEMSFMTGRQGFLLASWTLGEDGNWAPGHRLIFTYTYQDVGGVMLPKNVVVNRESHHEVWRYSLSDCMVKTG